MHVISFLSANISGLDISVDLREDSEAPILCHRQNQGKVAPGEADRSPQLFWCGWRQIALGDSDSYTGTPLED